MTSIQRSASHDLPAGKAPYRRRATTCATLASASLFLLAGCWGDGDSGVAATTTTTATYSVGGSVVGLSTTGLVLGNGNDTTSVTPGATSFTFPTALATGASYAVTVNAQPTNATCAVSGGNGTVAAAPVTGISVTCRPLAFTVGGSITGLSAAGLVLANGADSVAVPSGAAGFTLPTAVPDGSAYAVTVLTQPSGEHCSLARSTGTIGAANVSDVAVVCAAAAHSLGGTISGLPSAGLVLANGSDTVSPAAGALAFTFSTQVAEGGAYAVSVRTQPTGATCSVGSGAGTMGTADIASVQVTCSANAYHLSGTIAGLSASGLILANGADTVAPAANAASFAFAGTVAFGGSYSVTVQRQPTGLTCTVAGMYPATIGAGDVSNIAVTCVPAGGLSIVAGQVACPAFGPYPDGTGAAASLPFVTSFVADAAGNFYAGGGGSVRRITPQGVVTTLAGQPGNTGSVDGIGAAADFIGPNGLALDNQGNLLAGDSNGIRRITPQGGVTLPVGARNQVGFVNGTGSGAQFSGATGVAIDTTGNLFVADTGNNAIRKVTPAGVVTTFAGNGVPGFVDGTGAAARFNQPIDIVIDAAGNLYVTDALNNAVRKITPSGAVSTLAGAGPGNPGFADGIGALALFRSPERLATGAGLSLYVSDQQFGAVTVAGGEAVRVIDTATGSVTTLAVTSDYSANHPSAIPSSASVALPPSHVLDGIGANSQGQLFVAIGCSVQRVGP